MTEADWAAFWEGAGNTATLVIRSRYSLLTILGPVALATLAIADRVPGLLYSLLLLRSFHVGATRWRRFAFDLLVVSIAAFAVTALGGVGVCLVAAHGAERLGAAPPDLAPPAVPGHSGLVAWSREFLAFCCLAAAVFPVACAIVGWREHSLPRKTWPLPKYALLAVACVVGGAATVATSFLVLGAIRASVFGPEDWILPFSPPPIADMRHAGDGLRAAAGDLANRLGFRAGYLEPGVVPPRLLAGQVDLIAAVLLAGLIYTILLVRSLRSSRPVVTSSTASYLLVALGAVGVVSGGIAFWGDRHGISPIALVLGWVFVMYWLCRIDHFFELTPADPSASRSRSDRDGERSLPTLAEYFRARSGQVPVDADGKRTMVVVGAAGGGIQAAAWTAEVLTGLIGSYQGFRDSLCVMSGVSGGAVGVAYVLAGDALEDSGDRSSRLDKIRRQARKSLLEPVAWGVAFADLVRSVIGVIPRDRLIDRGWALERTIEERMDFSDRPRGSSPRRHLRDLCPFVRSGSIPVPLFNSTCVETGQRIVLAPVRSSASPAPVDGVRALHLPEDYSRGDFVADPAIATAVRLSATFSYASPIARPTRDEEARWRRETGAADGSDLLSRSFCDGGYSENTGIVSALDACRCMLKDLSPEERQGWRVLAIRIEPFPLGPDGSSARRWQGFRRMLFGPADGLLSGRVATQQERAGRETRDFAVEMRGAGVEVLAMTMRFVAPPAEPPPLSWALSRRQQDAVEQAWKEIRSTFATRPLDHFSSPPTRAKTLADLFPPNT